MAFKDAVEVLHLVVDVVARRLRPLVLTQGGREVWTYWHRMHPPQEVPGCRDLLDAAGVGRAIAERVGHPPFRFLTLHEGELLGVRCRQVNGDDGGDPSVAEPTGPLRHGVGVLAGRSSALDDDLDTRACSPSVDLSPRRQRLLLEKLEREALTKGLREGLVHAAT